MKIVVDSFGGDRGVGEVVRGVVEVLKNHSDIEIILTGNAPSIESEIKQLGYNGDRLQVVHTTEFITNNDVPTTAIRTKKDSSLVRAFDILKQDDVCGLVSLGSTGAILTGGFMKVGRISGVSRPALCPTLPTLNGGSVYIMDCGANMDCKPENLVHFALMGNAYLKNVKDVENPRIALLSVGTEEHKGNELVHEVYPELKGLDINFVGNMEARDLLSGQYDLVVCDGFSGNVLLKSTEGAILALLSILKSEIKSSFSSKIGYLFMKKSFKNVKKLLDYNNHPGAVFMGCKKLIVKAHGSSKYTSIAKSIELLYDMENAKLIDKISDCVKSVAKESEE